MDNKQIKEVVKNTYARIAGLIVVCLLYSLRRDSIRNSIFLK
jgi:hypothetical protein